MKYILFCGAILGLTSVIMGAMGDHAFSLTPERVQTLQTGIRYNMIYAIFITVLALHNGEYNLKIPAILFTAGTIIFAGSIYILVITGIEPFKYLTPAGGILIMAGWASLIIIAIKTKCQPNKK